MKQPGSIGNGGFTSETLHPPGLSLTATNLDAFLGRLAVAASQGEVTVDLRGCRFVDLFSLVGLAFGLADLCGNGCVAHLDMDETDGLCSFLHRVGFFRVLSPKVRVRPAVIHGPTSDMARYAGSNPALLELTALDSDAAVSDTLDKLLDVLQHRLRYAKHDAYDLAIVFSELCHNVLDHNPDGAEGLAAMQVYEGTRGRFMQLVVADRGAGIAATLRRNPRFAHLGAGADAIMTSLELGASEHDDATRGNGLHHLVELSFKHHGTIHIRSGSGKVYFRMDRHRYARFDVPFLKGAQFAIMFPGRSPSGL